MTTTTHRILGMGVTALALLGLAGPGDTAKLSIARIYIEFNESANDLGFHVALDGEDWRTLKIANPGGTTIFEVEGKGPFGHLGMTELFFEGAEPSLDDVPLADLFAMFPEGRYKFSGQTVNGLPLTGTSRLTHAVPAGPEVSVEIEDDEVEIRWEPVTGPPPGFPNKPIVIDGYQVIVGSFQVTLPAHVHEVTLPEELVESLGPGLQLFEVLAIEKGGNQTITEGEFELP